MQPRVVHVVEGPLYASITERLPAEVNSALYEELAVSTLTAQWADKAQVRGWDGVTRLYNVDRQSFRSGLVPRVMRFLGLYDIQCIHVNEVPPLLPTHDLQFIVQTLRSPEDGTSPLILRPYQERIANSITNHPRSVVWAVPRSGKTVTVGVVIAYLNFPQTLFLCADTDIMKQTVLVFRHMFAGFTEVTTGFAGDGEFVRGNIMVCTRQTLARVFGERWTTKKGESKEKDITKAQDREWLRSFVMGAELEIIDEVHEVPGSTQYRKLLRKTPVVRRVVGISGTPFCNHGEDILLEGAVGNIYPEGIADYDELITAGYLLRPTFLLYYLPRGSYGSRGFVKPGYHEIYKQCVVYSDLRNSLIAWTAGELEKRNLTNLVIVRYKAHIEMLKNYLPKAEFTFGSDKHRDSKLKALRNREIPTLVATIFKQGVDIPTLNFVTNGEGGESAIAAFQRVRCSTAYPGKTKAGFIDLINGERYLKKHSLSRVRQYESVSSFDIRRFKVSRLSGPHRNGMGSYEFVETTGDFRHGIDRDVEEDEDSDSYED